MNADVHAKAVRFRTLHQGPGAFVIANAWDAGSARVLEGLGFVALATSSGACANTLGRRDGRVTREEALSHARAIVEATALPVSADLEKGFGDAPEDAALTIRLAGEAGLAGGSIEDGSGDKAKPIYDIGHATERVASAVCAAVTKPVNFMAGIRGKSFTVEELEGAGVRRVSLATSLYRAAMAGFLEATQEVRERGTFTYLERALTSVELGRFMRQD